MKENRDFYVYTLNDPRTEEVKYVGCTVNPKSRLSSHMQNREGTQDKKDWMSDLKLNSLKPIMKIHARTKDAKLASKFEKMLYWEHDKGQLVCVDPDKLPYSDTFNKERLSPSNTEKYSSVVAKNLLKLVELNNVPMEQFLSKCRLSYKYNFQNILIGKEFFFAPDTYNIARQFNTELCNLIKEDHVYSFIDNPETRFTNRWRYAPTEPPKKP